MSIKGILFDLGNTLLYFDGRWPEVLASADRKLSDALSDAGLDLDKEAFSSDFRARLVDYHIQREVDFIKLRRMLAEGHPWDDELIHAISPQFAEAD